MLRAAEAIFDFIQVLRFSIPVHGVGMVSLPDLSSCRHRLNRQSDSKFKRLGTMEQRSLLVEWKINPIFVDYL